MRTWLRRSRAAAGIGLTWAAVGAMIGFAIELVHNVWPNPLGSMVDIWPAALGLPAFLGGVAFSVVLGIAGRHRTFDELSLLSFAAFGAVGGLVASLLPAALVLAGLATPNVPLGRLTIGLAVPLALGSALAAPCSLALARTTENRARLDADSDGALPGPSGACGSSEA